MVAQRFHYHRSLAPLVWVLVALSVVELGVVHLLVALLWSGWIALALSLVAAGAIAWLVALIGSFRRLPVELDGDRLLMRVGFLASIALRRDQIRGQTDAFTADQVKARTVLRLSLVAFPNVMIELTEPVARRRRRICAVVHRLDDRAAFAKAFAAWQAMT